MLGVSEGTVRYHLSREGVEDGRTHQKQLAEGWSRAIEFCLTSLGEGPVNVVDLYDWLVSEHGYRGSLRSVQRYFRRRYPKPKRRARRRVETPSGAQAQVDWAEWPRVWIAGQVVYAYQLHMRLSHSRFGARVWSPRKDQLSWHASHNAAFRRIDGIPATLRVDNERTAMSRGAGPWGECNASYRSYAKAVRFHIDACLPRSPQAKGKVERGIRTERGWHVVTDRHWSAWEELQEWTDERAMKEATRRVCPATGTSVLEAWEAEKAYLAPLPYLS